MRCKILVKAPYSDYQGTGSNRVARVYSPGDVVDFPDIYAKALEETEMVEILTGYAIEGVGVIEIEDPPESIEITSAHEPPLASDSAVEYAGDHGINLSDVNPSGADGRIILADVRAHGSV